MHVLRPHFRRLEAHQHAADYLRGLLAEVERKNGWQLVEQAGYSHPRGIQRVLDRSVWDPEAVRDDLCQYAVAALGHPDGILVVDETRVPKQGKHSAGVARQYCGTLGKVANCQVGVFLGYASPKGHGLLDRALCRTHCLQPVLCLRSWLNRAPRQGFKRKTQTIMKSSCGNLGSFASERGRHNVGGAKSTYEPSI